MRKKILPIYIILNLIYNLIGSYLFFKNKISLKTFSYGYIILLIVNILVILSTIIIKKIKKQKISINITDIFIILILIFSVISTIFAVNKHASVFGHDGRYEGLLSICYYFTLMIITTKIEKKYKKLIIYSILILGFINFLYAYLQVNTTFDFISRRYKDGELWAVGFISNQNFFGTLMLLCLSYAIGLFAEEKNRLEKIINIFFIFCFTSGLLMSNTLSCFVGLIVVLLYLIVYLINEKKYKKIFTIFFIIIISSTYLCICNKTTLINDYITTTKETNELAKGNLEEQYGTKRMFIWKNALKIVPKYIIHGAGIDNFYYAFGDKPLSRRRITVKVTVIYDKAHNEYLQILVCEGIFALISYLLFYSSIVFKGIKLSYNDKKIYLLLPIIGYLTQAFFNISVIQIAPIFYMTMGLCIERNDKYE